jgi:hypothetical protein
MFNLTRWQKNAYQVDFEGTSFFFLRKIPIAFRENKVLFIRSDFENQSVEAKKFVGTLSTLGKQARFPTPSEFAHNLKLAYKNCLFQGIKNLAMNRMHINEEPNVTINQNNDCETVDPAFGHLRKR